MRKKSEPFRQFAAPDKMAMRNAILDIKGEIQSLRAFSKETGVSLATLSRIINGRYSRPIDIITLEKIASYDKKDSEEALRDLMCANGCVLESEYKKSIHEQRTRELYRELNRRKNEMKSVIIKDLFERGYDFKKIDEEEYSDIIYPEVFQMIDIIDFGVNLKEQNLNWFFMLEPSQNEDPLDSDDESESYYISLLIKKYAPLLWAQSENSDYFSSTKLTFVFADDVHFRCFASLMKKTRPRHPFSAMYVDLESLRIMDEEIFSGLDGNEEKSEFFNSDRVIYNSRICYGDGWEKVKLFYRGRDIL